MGERVRRGGGAGDGRRRGKAEKEGGEGGRELTSECCFPPSQDDRYFLSGSLDGKLRLWNIPDKKVALWNEIEGVGEIM